MSLFISFTICPGLTLSVGFSGSLGIEVSYAALSFSLLLETLSRMERTDRPKFSVFIIASFIKDAINLAISHVYTNCVVDRSYIFVQIF